MHFQNRYIGLIEKASHHIYIENQFFVSGLSRDHTTQFRNIEIHNRIIQVTPKPKHLLEYY